MAKLFQNSCANCACKGIANFFCKICKIISKALCKNYTTMPFQNICKAQRTIPKELCYNFPRFVKSFQKFCVRTLYDLLKLFCNSFMSCTLGHYHSLAIGFFILRPLVWTLYLILNWSIEGNRVLWVLWGEQEEIFWVLVLDGRLQDEGFTRCGSWTNSKFKVCEKYVTDYVQSPPSCLWLVWLDYTTWTHPLGRVM
jgi:hypothetical protein